MKHLLIGQGRPATDQREDSGEDGAPGGRVGGQRGAQVVQCLQAMAPRSVQVTLRVRDEAMRAMLGVVLVMLSCRTRIAVFMKACTDAQPA